MPGTVIMNPPSHGCARASHPHSVHSVRVDAALAASTFSNGIRVTDVEEQVGVRINASTS